jgi:hypothetical protein
MGDTKKTPPANVHKMNETDEQDVTLVDESLEVLQLIEEARRSPTVHRTRSRATDIEHH